MIRRLLAVMLLAAPLYGQQARKIENPPRFNRRAFLAEASLLAASKTADAITTRQLLNRGGVELNPIFGRHPAPAKQSLINLGIFGAQAGLLYATEHSRHAWIRWAGRAFIGHAIVEHSRLAACNAGIDVRVPGRCSPY